MRHLLHVLLRIGRTEEERDALRGDLDETYATEIRPSRSWLGAQAWYATASTPSGGTTPARSLVIRPEFARRVRDEVRASGGS